VYFQISGSGSSSLVGVKLTPQERLKRKMQAALNKQLKADKEAEKVRQEKLDQERMEREETLREMSIKYRRRLVLTNVILLYPRNSSNL
jgi:uncharacterized membrane protein (DUF106 family)